MSPCLFSRRPWRTKSLFFERLLHSLCQLRVDVTSVMLLFHNRQRTFRPVRLSHYGHASIFVSSLFTPLFQCLSGPKLAALSPSRSRRVLLFVDQTLHASHRRFFFFFLSFSGPHVQIRSPAPPVVSDFDLSVPVFPGSSISPSFLREVVMGRFPTPRFLLNQFFSFQYSGLWHMYGLSSPIAVGVDESPPLPPPLPSTDFTGHMVRFQTSFLLLKFRGMPESFLTLSAFYHLLPPVR